MSPCPSPAFVGVCMCGFPWCSFHSWSLDAVSFVTLTISGSGIWLFSLQTAEVSYGYSPNLLLLHGLSRTPSLSGCARYFRGCLECCFFNLHIFWQFFELLYFLFNVCEWFRVNPSVREECLTLHCTVWLVLLFAPLWYLLQANIHNQ